MSLSGPLGKSRFTKQGASLTNSTLTDNIAQAVGPVKVFRLGLHATVAKTTGTALVITVQSVAGVTETALGTFTSPDTIALAATVYKEFNPPLAVAEGRYMKVESTTAGNDGSSFVWVEYTDEPMTKGFLDTAVSAT